MRERDAAASSGRLERALAAFLRQELSAPVVSMQGFLDIIAEDAKRFRLDGAVADLDRMRTASAELAQLINRVIDAPEAMRREQEDFDSFQSRLRHDLRTPLNAIKGYSELLAEDMTDGASRELISDLAMVRSLADDLLSQIDAMVERTREPGAGVRAKETQPFEIVTDLLRAVAPVSDGGDVIARKLTSRILVVDDIASNRDLLSRRLLREGHQVETANDGASALNRLVSEPFDLILLDLMMPGMSGFEVLCRLKSSSRTRHIPVIMISALNELDATVRCIEAGAEDYVPKPFNPILLRARIGACLEKKWLRDREQLHLEQLRTEKQRSESLLLNILPQSVVTRMRNGETVADQFAEVTILFADLVGFTALATGLPPDRVLDILSTVFSHFDRAVAGLGLEKIKTIGDAYMVAGGLPVVVPDHARRVADLALQMLDIMNSVRTLLQIDLQTRIGIHTGPVVAGVIGTHKFIYDVWGDTVNTASRMETFGAAGQVHVSAQTRRILGNAYAFEPRGPLDIKGKGMMDTYFLLGTRT